MRRKFLFFDSILCYLILCFALVWGIQGKENSIMAAGQIESDSDQDEIIDEYHELPKRVALTYDDGPHPVYTPMLLDGLKEKNVKATFFLLGKQVELYPEIVKRMYDEGHTIGNHSYKHEQLSKLNDEQACFQVNRTNEMIYKITGEYPAYLRPPFGDWKENLDCEVTMVEVLWDLDTLDWSSKNHAKVVNKIMSKVEDGDIILMHDSYATTVSATLEIIDKLREQGYDFVSVEELILE